MKITIGGREQIGHASLLVPKSDDAWLEFGADAWNVRIHVVFVEDPDEKDHGFTLRGIEDYAELTFKNWNRSLPAAIDEPFELGRTAGRKIEFLFTGYAVGAFKRIDFSFFWGANDGK